MRKLLSRGLSAFIVLIALVAAADARGQGMQRYQPSRPTVSPYMNLFRNNVGPLPNYYSLVRPQLNQLAFNDQVLAQQIQQNASLTLLQSQAGQQGVTPTGKSSWFMTYGRQTFMAAPGGGAAGGRR